jgi:hypothetical protein
MGKIARKLKRPSGPRLGKLSPPRRVTVKSKTSSPVRRPDATLVGAGEAAGLGTPTRPHSGYATERAAYGRRKSDLLRDAPGGFVAFVGEQMVGPFGDFRSVLKAGLRRFGPGPLYIKQVLDEEPVAESGAAANPCRS